MALITLTREETVPFLDSDGLTMQMSNFRFSASVTSEAGDSEEDTKALLDKLFDEQKSKVSEQIPLLNTRKRQLSYLLSEIRSLATKEKIAEIEARLKSLKNS